ncbi:MAG: YncE family protein, partial [Cruoricaptor ignavus]|nr:YncE family protein [Cruoricaptor ignavus]
LSKIKKDDNGNLWVTSRGNYSDISPKMYVLNPNTDKVIKEINLPISNFDFVENRMYYIASAWTTAGMTVDYGIINTDSLEPMSYNFILNNVQSQIVAPYAITVNPENGDIFISDAKDYVSPGELFCFTKNGNLKWRVTTGDIPGHFAFLGNN